MFPREEAARRHEDRIRLKHVRVGGRIMTTQADLVEFFEAVAEADTAYFDQCAREAENARR